MGEALISRLISLKTFPAEAIAVGDPSAARRQFLVETYGVQALADNQAVLANAEVVLVAVKPQAFAQSGARFAGGSGSANLAPAVHYGWYPPGDVRGGGARLASGASDAEYPSNGRGGNDRDRLWAARDR